MTSAPEAPLEERARAGDAEAFAGLCAAVLPEVHDFALRMTRDVDLAAEVARLTMTEAAIRFPSLPAGATFRSWVLGIARRGVLAAQEEVGSGLAGANGVPGHVDPRALAVVDLHLRQRLRGEELATAMGMTTAGAEILIERVVPAVEDAFAAQFLAGRDRRCRALGGRLAATQPATGAAFVRVVTGHRKECKVCRGRLARAGSPLAAYTSAPIAELPDGFVEDVVALAMSHRGGRAPSATALTASDLPPPRPPRATLLALFGGTAAAAALLAMALFLPASPLSLSGPEDPGSSAFFPLSPTPEGTPRTPPPTPRRTATPTRTVATATPTQSATPLPVATLASAPTVAPTETPSSTPTSVPPTATAAPTDTPTPGPTPTPCPPQLDVNLTSVNVGENAEGVFQVLNRGCGSLPFTASVALGSRSWLAVTPESFTISGATNNEKFVILSINRTSLPEGATAGTVTISGAGSVIEVTVQATRAGEPPVIVSASGSCEAQTATVQADVTDDIAMGGVDVTYSPAGSVILSPQGGDHWQRTFQVPEGATDFILVARDASGKETSQALGLGPC